MKPFLLFFIILLFYQNLAFAQNTFDIEPTQSMLMTGKGPGQDATINPYKESDCIAVVENLGKNPFSVRVQFEGKIKQTVEVKPNTSQEIILPKGQELYFDTEKKTRARISYKKKV